MVTQRAAVMPTLGEIEIRDVERPEPGPLQASVRIESVGVCGSDTTYLTVGRIGDWVVDGPLILGHETSGVVTAVGDAVTRVKPGDRVAIEPGTPCRNCHECMAGRYHLCPDLVFLATPPYDGSLQESICIDARNLFVMPDGMTFDQGAMLEPLSVGIWGCHKASLQPGEDVLVTGAGPVGLLAASVARALGARRIVVSDVSPFRVGVAEKLGFEPELVASGDVRTAKEFDVHLECSGAEGALAAGMERLRCAGRAAMIGMPKHDVAIPLARLNLQEVAVYTVNRYAHTWPIAISLVSSGRVDVDPLITHHFPLADTKEALLLSRHVPDSIKAIVHPQQ